ncbi:MAG: histidine kinase [Hymenobacter sp.]|nr:MAG: histidine kinase [Hymenobacter sp.]
MGSRTGGVGSFGPSLSTAWLMPHSSRLLRWHSLLWLAYLGYAVLGLCVAGHVSRKALWGNVSLMVGCLVTFYFCYLLVFPHLLRTGRLLLLTLGLVAAVLVLTGVRAALEEGLYPLLLGFQNYEPGTSFSIYLFDGLYYTIPIAALSAALWAGETALRREREHRQLTEEKRVAEAAFLKTQLNPHFLYNTLNMLYSMAYGVDKGLANSLLKLSDLMRYMLRDTPDGLVELSAEIEYLDNFLDLYRLRYPGRLCAELTVQGNPTGYRVAPLLLIPFVENAFKHGVLDDPATPVRLLLTLTAGTVAFTVENQRHNYQADATSGIGLTNLRRRLELLYPGSFCCQAGPIGAQFRAHLRLGPEVAHPREGSAIASAVTLTA